MIQSFCVYYPSFNFPPRGQCPPALLKGGKFIYFAEIQAIIVLFALLGEMSRSDRGGHSKEIYFAATVSISTSAPRGRSFTANAARAG
jgi:hypothetical protein